MTELDDNHLRARFAELRDYDSRNPPDFAAVARRASESVRTTSVTRPRSLIWIGAAAACVLVAAPVALYRLRHADVDPAAVATAPAITAWRSPTAGLLRTSGQALFAPPPLLSSVLDGVGAGAFPSRGDRR